MLLKKSTQFLLMLVAGLGMAGIAQATMLVSWDFRDSTLTSGNVGIEETFTATDGTTLMSATGWTSGLGGAATADVYVSRAGVPTNWGLGVQSTGDTTFNQLDSIGAFEFLSFQALGSYSFTAIELSSVLDDSFGIFGSNSADASGATLLLAGTGTSAPQTFSFDASGYSFLHIQPEGGDAFRVSELHAEVPEPTTLALMGIGLAGIGFFRRKKA
jgi:hypothetical protein